MMNYRFIVLVVLALAPFISSGQGRVEVRDPEITFSYILPEGWQGKDDGYTYKIYSPEVKGAFISITYVQSAKGTDYIESLGELTFKEDFELELNYNLVEEYPNLKVEEQGTVIIDETQARWARFQSEDNGKDRISIFYMFPKHNQIFKITGTAPAEHFEKLEPTFTSIIKSVKSDKK